MEDRLAKGATYQVLAPDGVCQYFDFAYGYENQSKIPDTLNLEAASSICSAEEVDWELVRVESVEAYQEFIQTTQTVPDTQSNWRLLYEPKIEIFESFGRMGLKILDRSSWSRSII